jgi:hypothetical protein
VKLAIVGSRTFNDYELLKNTVYRIKSSVLQIISGGAKGADSLAKRYADDNDIELVEFIPDWNKYGRSAGFRRNVEIVENCDALIAFWDGVSNGTNHSINLAKEKIKK